MKYLLAVIPFAKSPALSPTLYKFIVLGSLGLYSNHLGLRLEIVSLQYIYIYIYIYYKKIFLFIIIIIDLNIMFFLYEKIFIFIK